MKKDNKTCSLANMLNICSIVACLIEYWEMLNLVFFIKKKNI